jgi:tetratricopeptide (TPR) repeat protein
VNLPEFLNAPFAALDRIEVPVVRHHVHMLEAQRRFKDGDTKGAAASLEKAIEADPTFIRALVNLSYALILLGRDDQALEHLDIVLKEDPRNLLAWWNRHLVFRNTERPLMAKKALDRLLEIAPAFPAARQDVAELDEELASIRKSLEACEEALAREPGDVNLTLRTADLNHRLGNLERVVVLLSRACSLEPDQVHATTALAWLLATNPDDSVRNGTRAIIYANAAIRLTKGEVPEMFDILAAALAEAGNRSAAIRASERAVELAKKKSSPNLAVIQARLEKPRKSEPVRSLPDR